ncbi:MAG TPA: ABC transporter substrate-binding protein [Chloroflexota bacterium]|jgi:NitT/TauT family transport system substrate-binding protein
MRRDPRFDGRLLVLAALALVSLTAQPLPRPAAAAPATADAAGAPVGASPPAQTVALRYGSPGAITDAGLFIARARGYFAQQGIDLEMVPFQTGPDAIPLMATGELDAAAGTHSIALLNAAERGLGVRIVAGKGVSRPGFEFTHIVVRRDLIDSGAVRDVADLRGRRLAIASLRSGAEAAVARMLAGGGLTVSDVELTALGFPDMVPAFGNGAIDGANMIEPFLSAAVNRGVATAWEPGRASALYGGVYQAGIMLFSGRLAGQTDLARRYMIAYVQGTREYDDALLKGERRDDVIRILSEQTNVHDPSAYAQMQMGWLDPDGAVARDTLRYDMDYFRQQGYYSGSVTFDDLIDTSFAEYAAQQLGPYR